MSLTSFLQQSDVRAKFNQEFPKPKLVPSQEILAPLVTKNPRLIGTAFDYLMRFHAKYVNPQAIEQEWIAEKSLRLLRQPGFKRLYEQGYLIITQAKENYLEFIQTGQATEALIQSAIGLAKLDLMYRIKKIDENLDQIESRDVEDLKKLIALIEPEKLKSSGVVVLNPTFGLASKLVGAADGDLIVDDLLIEIKTFSKLKWERDDFNQLIGYYTLARIGSIDGAPLQHEIKRLGIYFSRHAYLHVIPIENVIDERLFPQFIEWFQKRAEGRAVR
jgi:hypothetical protein